jgi:multiple antibiotic resistance protein
MASHATGDGGIPPRDAARGLKRVMTLGGAYGTRNYTIKDLREMDRRRYQQGRTPLALALAAGIGCLIAPGIASAAETAFHQQIAPYPMATIFTFLLLMLGPFKIIGPFAKLTKGADAPFVRQIALRATFFAILALLLAALLGRTFLDSYGIPLPVLALSGGIILFLVALQNILQQFTPTHHEETSGPAPTPSLSMALTPLAFPTIVTPYGIAALVVFVELSPDLQSRLMIGAIVLVIMLLNLLVMILTRYIPPILGLLLAVLGAVLGVIQVAFGLRVMYSSLKVMGVV